MSYLATLRVEAGEYYDDENTVSGVALCLGTWDQALSHALGFCGCGDPLAALRYIRDVLRLVAMKGPDSMGPDGLREWTEWYNTVYLTESEALFHGDDGARFVAFYLLDDKGLTEHGGSVPGWLTDKGKGILADLEAHSAEIEADD